MDQIKDYSQRQRALRLDESFIVQAPAGSGKTELLIQRYLRLLSRVEQPEEIIAITFTRKAAAEMQGRVMEALQRARTGEPLKDDATRVTDELAHEVLAQDNKHDWQLEHSPGQLRIQTIDALCARITRQMPILSRFGAPPETTENVSELYREAAADALAELESGGQWADAVSVLLAHLDNDLPRLRNMVAGMMPRRYQWLRHVTGGHRREELEGALRHIVQSTLKAVGQSFPQQFSSELIALLQYASDRLVREGSTSLICQCHGIERLPQTSPEELPVWRGIAEFLMTRQRLWRKQASATIGFPPASGSKAESAARKAMKDRYAALLASLSGDEILRNRLEEVQCLPPVAYTDNEWQVVNALCQLLIVSEAKLRVLFAERNQIDFTGIEQAAIQALGSEDAPADLALYLDYQIKHILVDEFQDISVNQYVLLEKLTAGWSAEDGHTMFLVGDPMQSIYRFREAEVGLFLTTWEQRRLGQVALTPLSITVNFRSRPGIVGWVNHTFTQVMPAIADSNRGAVAYARADAFVAGEDNNAVQLHPILNRDDQYEAGQVVKLIQEARRDDPDGRIAVLVRNRAHLRKIAPQLKKAGLGFRAVEIEELGQRPAIQDLMALTLALNHFADRISWLAVLRAPWCGLTLHDLLALAGEGRNTTVWECLQDDSRIRFMSGDDQQRLIRLRNVLKGAFAEQRRRSLRRWVESVWIKIGGPATLEDETDLENAHAFFELLDQFNAGGDLRSRDQFVREVAGLYAVPDVHAGDTLQLMTIHKSKGLEFDTVILPGLSRGSGKDETQLLLWMENPHETHQDLLLAPVKEAGQEKSPIYDYLKRLEIEKQGFEEGRLLYVAATRAKKQLHLVGSVNIARKDDESEIAMPRTGSLLSHLWPVVKDNFEETLKNYTPESTRNVTENKTGFLQLRRLTADWILPAPSHTVKWRKDEWLEEREADYSGPEFEWAGETIKHIGTVVHRCIQQIAEVGTDQWSENTIRLKRPFYELFLKRLGVQANEIGQACQTVEEALVNMIRDERGRWILRKEYTGAKNEYPISGLYNGKIVNIIIDRTFVDEDGTRWVIDYKTSRHEGPDINAFLDQEQERYRVQLEKYGALIRNIDDRPVRLGLYFPLLQGWREWELRVKTA